MDESLEAYFCTFCGAHSLILDVLVSELPCRQSDRSRVVSLSKHATQLLLDEGPCVKLKRGGGLVEKQYRYLCKGCGLPLAYLSHPFKDSANRFLYLIEDAFALTPDGKSLAQLDAEEKAKSAEVPIVIPIFNVKKTASEVPVAAAAAAAPSAAGGSAVAAAPASSSAAAAAAPVQAAPAKAGADAASASSAAATTDTTAAGQSKA